MKRPLLLASGVLAVGIAGGTTAYVMTGDLRIALSTGAIWVIAILIGALAVYAARK